MRKLLLGAAALFLMASCSGNGGSETNREDSNLNSDSTVQVDTMGAPAEQTHQESAQQESAQQDEEFASVVKALEKLPEDNDKIAKYLKSLGFTGGKKTSKKTTDYLGDPMEVEVEKYHYTLTIGEKTITFSLDYEDTIAFGSSVQKVTIEGDEEALDNYFRFAKKKYPEVRKKGNTVIIEDHWA